MGTTTEKLTYLNDTKGLLKDSINSLGGNITSQTTFRQYANELDSIYSRLPKVSGTGSSISLTPTLKGRLGIVPKGDTFQQSYSGKNLWNNSQITDTTIIKNQNNGFRITRISGGNNSPVYNIDLKANTTYTISCSNKTGTTTDQIVYCRWTKSDGTYLWTPNISSTSQTITVGSLNITNVMFYIQSTQQVDTYVEISDLMISTSGGDYEPYTGGIASPNPSYPQDIQSVTGLQTIDITGKNLLSITNQDFTISNVNFKGQNGKILVNGTSSQTIYGGSFINSNMFPILLKAGTYTISRQNVGSLSIGLIDNNGNTYGQLSASSTDLYTTFTLNNPTQCYLYFYVPQNKEINNELFTFQLEKGSTATTYEAYQSQTKELNLGKNLYNGTKSNIYFNASKQFQNQNGASTTNYIPAKEGDIFTISVSLNSDGIVIASFDENYNCITRSAINTTTAGVRYLTYTCPANTKYIIGSNNKGLITGMNTQLEKGQATSYSPYFTPIYLRKSKDGTYEDYITGSPDNWSIKRQIGSVVLDGTGQWSKATRTTYVNNSRFINHSIQLKNDANNIIVISDYFNGYTLLDLNINDSTGISSARNSVSDTSYFLAIQISKNLLSTDDVNGFKSWLSSNNTQVDYVLATETTEAITNQEIINQLNEIYYLQSYNGTTNITITSEDLELIMTASAIKGE